MLKYLAVVCTLLMAPNIRAMQQVWIGILTPNCNGGSLGAGTITCEVGARTTQYSLMTLHLWYDDNGGGGGTGYTVEIQACNEGYAVGSCTDATDWYTISMQTPVAGVVTLDPAILTRNVLVDDLLSWTIGINARRHRLRITGLGAPVANDRITVSAMLAMP